MSDLQLIEAIKAGDLVRAKELIRIGADLNQQDEQGWTPLNFAAGQGNLPLVKFLVENGADVLKVGRDKRTPYKIALAAERVSVLKYLKEIEQKSSGGAIHTNRQYCKAYRLGDLRKFVAWREPAIALPENHENSENETEEQLSEERIVFVHYDLSVTVSMWHNENVIFNDTSPAWQEFCRETLRFKVPDEMELAGISGSQE